MRGLVDTMRRDFRAVTFPSANRSAPVMDILVALSGLAADSTSIALARFSRAIDRVDGELIILAFRRTFGLPCDCRAPGVTSPSISPEGAGLPLVFAPNSARSYGSSDPAPELNQLDKEQIVKGKPAVANFLVALTQPVARSAGQPSRS